MSGPQKPAIYREMIDELVRVCKNGQGQIGAKRAREGVWNQNATPDFIPEQHEINLLLKRMPPADREVLAGMLVQEVVTGVFETLKVLEQYQIEPFKDGYEGSPFNDFIGRLGDWNWPEAQRGAAPNGGPATPLGSPDVRQGPPSVS
jgi:hypothetical protein